MTAAYLFRVQTTEAKHSVRSELTKFTAGKFDVDVEEYRGALSCFLNYALKSPDEEPTVKKIISYLQCIASGPVLYVPCSTMFDEETKESDAEIDVGDIFERYYPSLSASANSMYRIRLSQPSAVELEDLKKSILRAVKGSSLSTLISIKGEFRGKTIVLTGFFEPNVNEVDIEEFSVIGAEVVADFSDEYFIREVCLSGSPDLVGDGVVWVVPTEE